MLMGEGLSEVCSTVIARAKQSTEPQSKNGLLRRGASRNDGKYESAIPRRDAPELCINSAPRKQRAWGMRVPAAPIASRAKMKQAHERSHHRYSRIHPAFPHAMV